jgi:hypothetical protein
VRHGREERGIQPFHRGCGQDGQRAGDVTDGRVIPGIEGLWRDSFGVG